MKCALCETEAGDFDHLTIDRIIPLSKGGNNRIYNMQLACRPCNLRKGNKF